jgi:glutathione S-transferase
MKLYYSPGACSLGIHVILEEIGKPYELSLVALKDGAQYKPEFQGVNPKSKVPTLDPEDGGAVLTEFTAIALYLGLSNPEANLIHEGAWGVARAAEAVDYITGTVHTHAFTRQFRPGNFVAREDDHPHAVKVARENAQKYFGVVNKLWAGGDWWLKSGYSVADAALFFVEYWQIKRVGEPVPPRIQAHFERMLARPAVRRALEQEGLPA